MVDDLFEYLTLGVKCEPQHDCYVKMKNAARHMPASSPVRRFTTVVIAWRPLHNESQYLQTLFVINLFVSKLQNFKISKLLWSITILGVNLSRGRRTCCSV
jgi:hypothetical protein